MKKNILGKIVAAFSISALAVSFSFAAAKGFVLAKDSFDENANFVKNEESLSLKDQKLNKEIKYLNDYEVKFASALLNQVFAKALRENGFSQTSSIVMMNNKPYIMELNRYSIIYQGEPENLRRFSARNIFELKNTEETRLFTQNSNILFDFREEDSNIELSEAKNALSNLLTLTNISYDEIVKIGTSVNSADDLIQSSYLSCKPFLDGLFTEATQLPDITGEMLLDKNSTLSTNQQVVNYIANNMNSLISSPELTQ